MNVTGLTNNYSSLAEAGTNVQEDIVLLKRAQQIEAASVGQMVADIPPPPKAGNPPHLGTKIDTKA